MLTRREFLMQSAAAAIAAPATVSAASAENAHALSQTAPSRRTPGIVQTVQGPLDASKLGSTLPHEHIYAGSAGFLQVWPEFFGGRANFIAKVIDKLKAAKDEGIDTIVDVTPADIGRDIRLLEEVSRKSGMQIIACTGHWLIPALSMEARTANELGDFFTLEIERGLEGTGIKPGVIKVATDRDGVTPFLDRALRAAARASKATGVPVTTHTYAQARIAEKQAAIFEEEGLNPAMVCLGHCDDSDDMAYLTGLVKRGYTIGMDHLTWGPDEPSSGQTGGAGAPGSVCEPGSCAANAPPSFRAKQADAFSSRFIPVKLSAGGERNLSVSARRSLDDRDPESSNQNAAAGPLSWQRRAQSIKTLVDAGFAKQIFLSNDWYFGISIAPTGFMQTKDKQNPDGILFTNRKIIPYLKQIGLTDQQIRTMTVDNPKRFFGGQSA